MTPAEAIRSTRRGFAEAVRTASHAEWLIGLTVLALALRVGFVLAFEPNSLRLNDAFFYHGVATELSDGHGFSFFARPTAHWPPVVPFLYSLVYRVFGPEPVAAALVNAALGAATVPLLYAAALRSFGTPAARFAGIALALMPGQILFADVLISETTYTFLLVAFVALIAFLPARRWWAPVALGAVAGVAALARGEGLVLPLIALVAWYPELPRRALLTRLAALVAAMAVVVVPWVVRNSVKADTFVGVSTNYGTTFWSGHNPGADGAATYSERAQLGAVARKSGIDYEVSEARRLRAQGLRYMRSHPLRELELIPLKLVALNQGDSNAIGGWIHDGSQRAIVANRTDPGLHQAPPVIGMTAGRTVGVLADAAYFALLATTLASLALFGRGLWRRRAVRAALAILALAVVLYGFVYYGNFRYHVPLEPLMILVAAPLAAALPDLRRRAP